MAINLLIHFDNSLEQSTSSARKLMEELSKEQIKHIYNHEPVEIEITHKNLIQAVLDEPIESKENEKFINLDSIKSSKIRWLTVKYLNLLETVLEAWNNGIADSDIIKTQLRYLYSPKDSSKGMETFREIVDGKNTYPAIHAFISSLKKEHDQPNEGKPPIGK